MEITIMADAYNGIPTYRPVSQDAKILAKVGKKRNITFGMVEVLKEFGVDIQYVQKVKEEVKKK